MDNKETEEAKFVEVFLLPDGLQVSGCPQGEDAELISK